MRGYMKYESRDYEGAIAAFDSAIRLNKPDDASWHYINRAIVKRKLQSTQCRHFRF